MAKSKKANQAVGAAQVQPGRAFKVVRNVTLPVFKLEIEVPIYVTIKDAMRVSNAKKGETESGKGAKAGGKQMEPATVCTAVDLMTGEVKTLILSAVIKSIFTEDYPGDAYVGKSFCLVKHAKKEGKNYFNFSVDEIDPEQPTAGV